MTRFLCHLGTFVVILTWMACRGPIVTVIPNDWELFYGTKDGTDYYYNVNLMRYATGDAVEVWVKIFVGDDDKKKDMENMTKNQHAGSGWQRWSHNICLLEVDCMRRHLRWVQFTYYDNDRNVLYSSSSEGKGNWISIEPDSMGDHLQKKACKIRKRKQGVPE